MHLPPPITRKLLQATSDKTRLNHQALRISQSIKGQKLLDSGRDKKQEEIKAKPGPVSLLPVHLHTLICRKKQA